MNKQNLIKLQVISSLLLGLVLSAPAMAGDEESTRLSARERLQQVDTDGDRRLSRDERQAAKQIRRENQRERFDANEDGRLNRYEREDARDRWENRADRREDIRDSNNRKRQRAQRVSRDGEQHQRVQRSARVARNR